MKSSFLFSLLLVACTIKPMHNPLLDPLLKPMVEPIIYEKQSGPQESLNSAMITKPLEDYEYYQVMFTKKTSENKESSDDLQQHQKGINYLKQFDYYENVTKHEQKKLESKQLEALFGPSLVIHKPTPNLPSIPFEDSTKAMYARRLTSLASMALTTLVNLTPEKLKKVLQDYYGPMADHYLLPMKYRALSCQFSVENFELLCLRFPFESNDDITSIALLIVYSPDTDHLKPQEKRSMLHILQANVSALDQKNDIIEVLLEGLALLHHSKQNSCNIPELILSHCLMNSTVLAHVLEHLLTIYPPDNGLACIENFVFDQKNNNNEELCLEKLKVLLDKIMPKLHINLVNPLTMKKLPKISRKISKHLNTREIAKRIELRDELNSIANSSLFWFSSEESLNSEPSQEDNAAKTRLNNKIKEQLKPICRHVIIEY